MPNVRRIGTGARRTSAQQALAAPNGRTMEPASDRTEVSWLEAVRQVVTAVRASDVMELELTSGAFSIRLRREPAAALVVGSSVGATRAEEDDARLHRVVAPFTGVFYRSPTPSAGAYADAGDWVDAETVIGLVETMKMFNEIKADVAGRIERFAVESGQLVHAGDALVLLEPGERATAESEPYL
jgi:acetyl-CoA carboxylase biotin carboxyl carrier protein